MQGRNQKKCSVGSPSPTVSLFIAILIEELVLVVTVKYEHVKLQKSVMTGFLEFSDSQQHITGKKIEKKVPLSAFLKVSEVSIGDLTEEMRPFI